MEGILIQVRDALCRLSAKHTLRVAHLDIIAGQHLCVFGGNGAGKSTLLQLLLGALPSGRAHVQYGLGFDPSVDCLVVSFEQQQALWAMDNRHDISEYSEDARDQGTTVRARHALPLLWAVPQSDVGQSLVPAPTTSYLR